LQQSDGVTAVSKFLKQATIETFDFDDVEVIPNFICENHYRKIVDSPFAKRTRAERRTDFSSRLQFPRCQTSGDCVEIFAKVLQKGGDARLVMVGDGPEILGSSSSSAGFKCFGQN
jgi:glycosyltransferase involved in cell wall biosynthesis